MHTYNSAPAILKQTCPQASISLHNDTFSRYVTLTTFLVQARCYMMFPPRPEMG